MKSNIYTKKGDTGETSLVSGKRVLKSEDRIHLYGEVDELNSFIGLIVSGILDQKIFEEQKNLLLKIQSALFDLGSNLACEKENRLKFRLPQLKIKLIEEIEMNIDLMDGKLPKLTTFILPGGSVVASYAHLCRTISRRVERNLVGYEKATNDVVDNALQFLNRLSDYFFVLSRFFNLNLKHEEIKWIAEKN